jgi:hypothetical protein
MTTDAYEAARTKLLATKALHLAQIDSIDTQLGQIEAVLQYARSNQPAPEADAPVE